MPALRRLERSDRLVYRCRGRAGDDADRIAATAKVAGIEQIDYLLITHFHLDHVGGVPALASRLTIKSFVDHRDTVEHDANGQKLFDAYRKEVAKGKHIIVKPGDKLPIKDLDRTICHGWRQDHR